MKLFSYQVPELAHLSVAEREAILRECSRSQPVEMYRRFAPKVVGAFVAVAGMTMAYLGWRFSVLMPAFIGVFAASMLAKLIGEVWVFRDQAKKILAERE